MRKEDIFCYCDEKLISFLSEFNRGNSKYFNLTISDVDNLGLFCAKNGRAITQNVVDYSINIIKAELQSFKENNNSTKIFISPSGEEVSIFSFSDKPDDLTSLASFLNENVNARMKDSIWSKDFDLNISFAGATITKTEVSQHLNCFFESINQNDLQKSVTLFYDFLLLIRKQVEVEIDYEKFSSLCKESKDQVKALRNFVYFNVIDHKTRVFNTLPLFSNHIEKHINNGYSNISQSYGIDSEKSDTISQILKSINNE